MLAYFNGTQTDLTGGYVSTEKCQTGQYGKVAVNQHVDQVRSRSTKVGQGKPAKIFLRGTEGQQILSG